MRKIDLDYVVIAGLIVSGLYVSLTGLVTDLLGLHQFAFHRYAGYACVAFAGLHLLLNWSRITAYLRYRFRLSPAGRPPTQRNRAPLLTRRGFVASTMTAGGGFVLGWLFPDRLLPERAFETGPADLGLRYHQWSTPGHMLSLSTVRDWGAQPARYKTYADANRIALSEPRGYRGLSLEEAIEQRRSKRDYTGEPLSLDELSRLLHAAQGITHGRGEHRAAPSAGALYPIELYPVVHNVTNLERGVYHYAVREHALELLEPGDYRANVVKAGVWQDFLGQANVCFLLSAIFQRTRWKYHERAYRYVLLEAGHIGQNLYLAATSMGLGACAVGAFLDEDLNALLQIDDDEEAAIYMITAGKV